MMIRSDNWPFPADVVGKKWLYVIFNTKSEARSLFAARIGKKWSIKNIVVYISTDTMVRKL